MNAKTIGVDLAKSSFEVAFADARGRIVQRRRLTRKQFAQLLTTHAPTEIVMESCATAHYWGRLAQQAGHRATLLPSQHVRPFVRRQKTDRTDVTGVLDARSRDDIHPVPVKTVAQQEVVALHRVREQWKITRVARINMVRGLLHEHGVGLPAGARHLSGALGRLLADAEAPIPGRLRRLLADVRAEIDQLEARLASVEAELADVARHDDTIRRLRTIPGVGLLTATALIGSVPHIQAFRRARCFASWLGLTAREHSTGQSRRLGRITKHGDVYLRCLLTHGARAVLLRARKARTRGEPRTRLQQWALEVADRRGHNRATIAVANKLARIIWAVWSRAVDFDAQPQAA